MNGAEGSGGIVGFLLPLAAMLLLFWALLIRPQQKQQREVKEMLAKLERGDAVVTSGGLHGTVAGVADDQITLEIAPGVRVKIDKSAVGRRAAKADKKEEKKEAKKS